MVEGLGCKAIRVREPSRIQAAMEDARKMANEYSVPVVVEILTERKTDIAMGPEIDQIVEFEETLDLAPETEQKAVAA